jgi:hypothetical protein
MKLFDVLLPPAMVVLAMTDAVTSAALRVEEMARVFTMSISVSAAILRESPASKWRSRRVHVEA